MLRAASHLQHVQALFQAEFYQSAWHKKSRSGENEEDTRLQAAIFVPFQPTRIAHVRADHVGQLARAFQVDCLAGRRGHIVIHLKAAPFLSRGAFRLVEIEALA